jgi:hypothetical protein
LLLTLFLTWPLPAHLASHVPGEATWAFDESTFLWNIWWFKYSILHLGQTPLESDYIFFPLGINLTTYTFNLFNAALALPLQLALSLPLSSNLTLLFSYLSSAYGAFLLALYLLTQPNEKSKIPNRLSRLFPEKSKIPLLAAFAAGAVFAFSASRMMYLALGHYNFVTIQWFPFYLLFLLKSLRRPTGKNIWLAALFAAFCLYAELTYSVFLLFLTLLVLIDSWLRNRNATHPFSFIHYLRSLALIGLVTFALTAPFILAVLPDFLDPAYAEPGWGEGLKLSADLIGLVTVTPLHPLSGLDWITELRDVVEGQSRFSDANTLFLGYGILALALLGFICCRRVTAIWFWSALFFTLLSLGPLLTINGQNRFQLDGLEVTFPLPFMLLHYIPILSANRVPNRFGIPLTLCLAILVAYGLAWLLAKLKPFSSTPSRPAFPPSRFTVYALRLTLYASLLTLLLFDQYSLPLPLTDARIPAVYEQIGAEAGDFSLMQLPLGWRNSYGTLGAERTQLQYYQAAHHRPMLGGNTSRNPAFKFDYYANIPLFAAITQAELYQEVSAETLAQARQQAAELMTLYNIKYLVIHEPIPFRKPYEDTYFTTRNLALELIPHQQQPVYQSPGIEVIAVEQAAIPNPMLIDFGHWTADPYRGEGWAGNEEIFAATANWATSAETTIFFPVRGGGERHLSFDIAPFSYPAMPEQQLGLSLNGQGLNSNLPLHEGWQTIELPLPEALLVQGLNRLTLNFAHLAQPRQVIPANTAIGQTGLHTSIDLEVNSSQEFAFITVGFGDAAVDASAHRRGINIAVVQPASGQLVSIKGFDTAANTYEAVALSRFMAEIPEGYIVIIASQGAEATAFFNEETLAALRSVGISTQEVLLPFAAIGVKGALEGTALQAAGPGNAYLRLGASADTRTLAAAVDKVIITGPETNKQ